MIWLHGIPRYVICHAHCPTPGNGYYVLVWTINPLDALMSLHCGPVRCHVPSGQLSYHQPRRLYSET